MKKLLLPLLAILLVGKALAQVKHRAITKRVTHSVVKIPVDSLGIKIGDMTWMKKNLNVSSYRNGDPIPNVTDMARWDTLTTGAYCYYDNDAATYASVYGKLYNWYAVNDPRGLAPMGWHVASDKEWFRVADFLGGDKIAGLRMMEKGHAHWHGLDSIATNSSGFTALPGGYRDGSRGFTGVREWAFWWTSTKTEVPGGGIFRDLLFDESRLDGDGIEAYQGYSVRCVKD